MPPWLGWLCGVSAPGVYASGWLCAIQLVRLSRASYIGSVLFSPSVSRVSCRYCILCSPSRCVVAVASRLRVPSGIWFPFSAAVRSIHAGVVHASVRCACACSFSLFILVVGYGLKLRGFLRLLIRCAVACFFLLSVVSLSVFSFFATVFRHFPLTIS